MTVFGPDVSKWQEGLRVDDASTAEVMFGIARASIGNRTDNAGEIARQWCQDHGKFYAAYHFVYDQSRGYPADVQADTFHGAVAGDVACMLDWESDGSNHPGWDDVLAVADAIRQLGHRVALVYTGNWYWSEQGSPTMSGHGFDLVNADYGPNNVGRAAPIYEARGGDTGRGWNGYGGLVPVLWQFGSRVQWGNKELDMNAYRGDPAVLGTWFTAPDGTTTDPDPDVPVPNPDHEPLYTPGAAMTTPPGNPMLERGTEHENVPWLQSVLASMPTLPADGGAPIYTPSWIGMDSVGSGPDTWGLFGDATYNALAYWQSKNGLTADGKYGPVTAAELNRVRGK